jgi:hypothetical protein
MPKSRRAGRERHLKNENGTKLRAQFIFDASTRAQLKRIACHKGCSVTSLVKEWVASAERTALSVQLSARFSDAQKQLEIIGYSLRQLMQEDRTDRRARMRPRIWSQNDPKRS